MSQTENVNKTEESEVKTESTSTFKKIVAMVGVLALGLGAGYLLGKRDADEEFYEVSYEDL